MFGILGPEGVHRLLAESDEDDSDDEMGNAREEISRTLSLLHKMPVEQMVEFLLENRDTEQSEFFSYASASEDEEDGDTCYDEDNTEKTAINPLARPPEEPSLILEMLSDELLVNILSFVLRRSSRELYSCMSVCKDFQRLILDRSVHDTAGVGVQEIILRGVIEMPFDEDSIIDRIHRHEKLAGVCLGAHFVLPDYARVHRLARVLSAHCPNLRVLSLDTRSFDSIMTSSENCHQLFDLEGARALFEKVGPNLQRLTIGGISGEVLELIVGHCPNLEILNVSGVLGNRHFGSIAKLKYLHSLAVCLEVVLTGENGEAGEVEKVTQSMWDSLDCVALHCPLSTFFLSVGSRTLGSVKFLSSTCETRLPRLLSLFGKRKQLKTLSLKFGGDIEPLPILEAIAENCSGLLHLELQPAWDESLEKEEADNACGLFAEEFANTVLEKCTKLQQLRLGVSFMSKAVFSSAFVSN